ncbi:MAG: DUF4276 family protein [Planctomycetia bacterium]|nr:DUF4276 family protein [Planctomycetia bacterium]
MTLYIAPVVEGQTEQGCLEKLLRRVWNELLGCSERLQVVEPFRGQRDALVHPSGTVLVDSVEKAFLKLRAVSRKDIDARLLLLILLDAENDCPATLAPRLLTAAKTALPSDAPIACVLPKRMLENWIVAGASTLAGVNGLPNPLPARDSFEDRSGANWLESQFRSVNKTKKYKKTVDAKKFVEKMNLSDCRKNAPSFDKLCRELEARLPPPEPEAAPPAPEPPAQPDPPAG